MKLLFVFSQLTKRTFLLALATLCAACAHAQVIATNDLHLGYIGQSYVGQMTATGGTGPYTWSVSGGTLPSGISLSSGGALSGTPSAGGTFSVTIQATDHDGSTANKTFTLTIFEQPTDKYGGLTNKTCTKGPQAHFYTQKMGGRWYLCTPAGNAFWMNGMYAVNLDQGTDYQGIVTSNLVQQKYATGLTTDGKLNWGLATVQKEQSWGINANIEVVVNYLLPNIVNPRWPTSDHTIPVRLPYVGKLMPTTYTAVNFGNYAGVGYVKNTLGAFKSSVTPGSYMVGSADNFDPSFAAWITADLAPTGYDCKYYLCGSNPDYLIGIIGDETDVTGGFREGVDFRTIARNSNGDWTYVVKTADAHWGWITLVTSPVETAAACTSTPKSYACGNPGHDLLYTDTKFYSKVELGNWVQQTNDRGPGYSSIVALNAAWGSNYDSFGSDALAHNGAPCAIGNGTAGPYACTLPVHPLTPLTVQVLVGGTLTAGDDGAGPRANPATATGNLRGNTGKTPLGTINYSTGAISITFASPVPSGAAIAANYQTNGWGTGHGLLDEDGTCPSKITTCWIPTDYYLSPATHASPPAGTTFAFITDMDNFLYHYAKNYGRIEKNAINNAFPGVLYLGPNTLGNWSTPARAPVIQGFSSLIDLFTSPNMPSITPSGAITDNQDRVNFVFNNLGDKPAFVGWYGFFAQSDSYMSPYPPSDAYSYSSQASRGTGLQTISNNLFNTQITSGPNAGTYPFVGYGWWTYYDMRSFNENWGFVTPRDDPYDGVSSTSRQGYDPWGYPTGCVPTFGCEQGSYGDFVGPATDANLNALRATAGAGGDPPPILTATPH